MNKNIKSQKTNNACVVGSEKNTSGKFQDHDVTNVTLAAVQVHVVSFSHTGKMLHHDNARPHIANVVTHYLAKIYVRCVPHPPYSPDLAPCDFFLFPNLKKRLRGQRFSSSEAVVKASEAILKDLSKNGLQHVFEDWKKRWDKCIACNRNYFEKDHQYLDD